MTPTCLALGYVQITVDVVRLKHLCLPLIVKLVTPVTG